MKGTRSKAVLLFALVLLSGAAVWWWRRSTQEKDQAQQYTGSGGCRECHENFYQKWSTSFHGLAMRPFTAAFAREHLQPHPAPLEIRGRSYRFEMGADSGLVRESGPQGGKAYPVEHVLGGKNVFFFLTPMPGGRLQVLPLAYDVRRKEWYDTTASMVRHVHEAPDEALDWTERPLTFNTSCYTCHVSQLEKNYSLETDSYQTTWGEPGINCESCHGPGLRHVQAARAAGDRKLDKIDIISIRTFSKSQVNSLCAPCHAKMSPLDASFSPGEAYFDHYNLTGLEDRDFYPDARDLGENFTYTLWLASPCAASGQLDCLHCHTSSGRYRFQGADADKACSPCHEKHVKEPAAHSFHKAESEGSRCVSCHMPETTFARMRRHDHTMLAPTPQATLRFKSPNACNLCHADKSARWADDWVRKWYKRDYQKPLIERAELIDAGRKEDWSRLEAMKAYVASPGRNELFAASLLRLMDRCPDPAKWPAFMKALSDPSPLVRSSAAAGLSTNFEPEALRALARAAADPVRVVRVQAGAALARHPLDALEPSDRDAAQRGLAEYEASMRSQPDDPRSHYNLGNFNQERGNLEEARKSYNHALRLQPSMVPALVNLSILSARLGDGARAESALRDALRHAPSSAEAHFNLGLLLAEKGSTDEAETHLRAALGADPRMAEAAFNLGVLLADRKPAESLALCRKALELHPDSGKYSYTLAFYLRRSGDLRGAASVLERSLAGAQPDPQAVSLLGAIYEETGRSALAQQLYGRFRK